MPTWCSDAIAIRHFWPIDSFIEWQGKCFMPNPSAKELLGGDEIDLECRKRKLLLVLFAVLSWRYGQLQIRIRATIWNSRQDRTQYMACGAYWRSRIPPVNSIPKVLADQQSLPCLCLHASFSQQHAFDKPNDRRAIDLMNRCAIEVMKDIKDITMAYGQSDEYR